MKPRHKIPKKKELQPNKLNFFQRFIRFFISESQIKKIFGLVTDNTHSKHNHTHDHEPDHEHSHPNKPEKTYKIAIILDNKVIDILTTGDKLADIFLAQPTFELLEDKNDFVVIGTKFIDGKFLND